MIFNVSIELRYLNLSETIPRTYALDVPQKCHKSMIIFNYVRNVGLVFLEIVKNILHSYEDLLFCGTPPIPCVCMASRSPLV